MLVEFLVPFARAQIKLNLEGIERAADSINTVEVTVPGQACDAEELRRPVVSIELTPRLKEVVVLLTRNAFQASGGRLLVNFQQAIDEFKSYPDVDHKDYIGHETRRDELDAEVLMRLSKVKDNELTAALQVPLASKVLLEAQSDYKDGHLTYDELRLLQHAMVELSQAPSEHSTREMWNVLLFRRFRSRSAAKQPFYKAEVEVTGSLSPRSWFGGEPRWERRILELTNSGRLTLFSVADRDTSVFGVGNMHERGVQIDDGTYTTSTFWGRADDIVLPYIRVSLALAEARACICSNL